ncbi:unnamed protein product [Angiostrongylus costaricensis]|uniref:PAP2_C domain-containing protein n=1 Tax=Angiostrongylus costaricensis TaxID=334426 RepID=A0A158PE70_ANGCS|nr:unnamed protein product [Angiostrongylus costaricensis]
MVVRSRGVDVNRIHFSDSLKGVECMAHPTWDDHQRKRRKKRKWLISLATWEQQATPDMWDLEQVEDFMQKKSTQKVLDYAEDLHAEPFHMKSFIATPVSCDCPSKVVIERYCTCKEETSTVCIPLRAHENWEYRPERLKTLLTVLCFFTVMFINHFVLAVISDIISRIPLPDLAHSLIKQYDTPRHLADLFASAAVTVLLLVCSVFHKYRWIITRRLFYIGSVLYIMRAISICLTHIPSGFHDFENDICVPPNPDPNPDLASVASKFLSILATFGLQVQMSGNKLHCGDMLFSGHTTAISTSCFFLNYYTPHSLWPLKLIAISSCIIAMFCIVISRIHYSVDVVMGYWISSIIFSVYHGFCEVPHVLRPRNRPFRRLFLFWTMFELERHVPEGRIPNKLEWPFPWPKKALAVTMVSDIHLGNRRSF